MSSRAEFAGSVAARLCAGGFNPAAVLRFCGYPRITGVAQTPRYTGSLIWGLYSLDGRRLEVASLQSKGYSDPRGTHRALVLVLTPHVWASAVLESKTCVQICAAGRRPSSLVAEDSARLVKAGQDSYYFCPICGGGYRLPSSVLDALIPKIRCGRISSV